MCPSDENNDLDDDELCGDIDNCPCIANPDQIDSDGDGMGDVCEDKVGDVDGNCATNILDVLRGVNIILQIHTPSSYETAALDCNGDRTINILDVLGVVNVILGIGECTPVSGKPIINEEVMQLLVTLEPYFKPDDYSRFMDMVKIVYMVPDNYSLSQNYPNPFNPTTIIHYTLPEKGRTDSGDRPTPHTTLRIYNLLGQEVRILVDEVREAGYYIVTWDGRDASGMDVASGVYFYRLTAGDFSATKRMVLMK